MANIMLYSKACKLLKGQRAVVEIQLCRLLLNNVHAHFSNNFSRIQSPLNFLLIELFIKKHGLLAKRLQQKQKKKIQQFENRGLYTTTQLANQIASKLFLTFRVDVISVKAAFQFPQSTTLTCSILKT